MENFKLIQVTPNELAHLISESVKTQIQELSIQLKETQPTKEDKDFLSRKETSQLFNVSLVTIHQWSNDKIIKPYKIGNRTFYKRSELLDTLYNSNRS